VHHALLNLGAAKMSKSAGNVIDLDAVAAMGVRPIELRYYLVSAHYRSIIDFSEAGLQERATAFRRIEGFVTRAAESVGALGPGPLPAEFVAAMDDDLNTAGALPILHDAVTAGNAMLADGGDVATTLASVRAMLGALGLDPLDPQWTAPDATDDLRSTVDGLVALALEQRTLARQRRDWAAADAVRDQLKQAGVIVEDTPHGPRWSVTDAR
jgi:cysteinyl-tRNA synthetase